MDAVFNAILFMTFLVFNLAFFAYVKEIFKDKYEGRSGWVFLCFFNGLLLFLLNEGGEGQVIATAITVLFIFSMEQIYIFKATFKQAVLISSMLTFHIGVLYFFVQISMISFYGEIPSEEMEAFLYKGIILTTFIMLAVLSLFWRRSFVDPVAHLYDIPLFANIIIVTNLILTIIMTENVRNFAGETQLLVEILLAFATSIFTTVLYYQLFFFTVKFSRYTYHREHGEKLKEVLEKLQIKERRLEKTKIYDDLMEIYRRDYIVGILQSICNDYQKPFVVFFADLNRLKEINDTFGHKIGDQYLKRGAELLKNCFGELSSLGRIGGDEILIISENLDNLGAMAKVEEIEKNLENEKMNPEELPLSISVGYVNVTKEEAEKGSQYIMELADKAMRENKKAYYEREGAK